MADRPKLTGFDYMTLPHHKLIQHPDYNAHVYRVMQAISNMETSQLNQIDIIGIKARS